MLSATKHTGPHDLIESVFAQVSRGGWWNLNFKTQKRLDGITAKRQKKFQNHKKKLLTLQTQ